MLVSVLETYESWDLRKVAIPSRSRLYQLDPIGIGTPLVESLTGYISRLAEAHYVNPGVLMEKELATLVKKEYGGANLHRIYNYTTALNGSGVMATDLVQALEKLTLRDDLCFLTLLTWDKLFPSRNLLRSVRAWCPSCYQEWYEKEQLIYEPLLWSLDVVKICPYHHHKLIFECPHCHQKNTTLAWRSRSGYCSKCGEWLGLIPGIESANKNTLKKNELEQGIWVAKAVGELIAATPYLHEALSSTTIALTLSKWVEQIAKGNIAEFARQINIPRNTVWLWCKGKNLPSLEALTNVCYCFGVTILSFLTEETNNLSLSRKLVTTEVKTTFRAKSKAFDAERVKSYLEALLTNEQSSALSMEQVAKELKVDRRTIYKHFPHLCRAISARYASYQKDYHQKIIEECCQEVRLVAFELHKQGKYPTESAVSALVSKPGYFRHKKVRLALKEANRELEL
ncbi:TetR family transcriptional regulator [Nostoc sp. C052]|uniref:TniQ family protein n=1 Tax=Nostoc sp. C052 TaxID=2576902 RepID=UPI0015C4051A|nr:TniQ family protein [Nostoc sp. C052]QLE43805.1 TetR family transcriptional regulator [Nostoc sp. C052]